MIGWGLVSRQWSPLSLDGATWGVPLRVLEFPLGLRAGALSAVNFLACYVQASFLSPPPRYPLAFSGTTSCTNFHTNFRTNFPHKPPAFASSSQGFL